MKLHENWLFLLKKSWSIRWAIIAGLFSGAEIFLPLFVDSMPRFWFAAAAMVCSVGGIVGRMLVQPKDDL